MSKVGSTFLLVEEEGKMHLVILKYFDLLSETSFAIL
jgi:hypothetical protein